jgi:hypothetical protein
MARGIYTLSGANLTLANAALTLAFINPGNNVSLEIIRVAISQSGSAVSAQQRVQLVTQPTSFPTLVAATPTPTVLLDQASKIAGGTAGAAGTAGVNASAEGAGSKTVVYNDAFNVLNGWLWQPQPHETIVMSASSAQGFGVFFPAAAASLSGWNVDVTYREW